MTNIDEQDFTNDATEDNFTSTTAAEYINDRD